MVAAGLLAFVIVLAILRDREAVVQIPVVVSDIAAGATVDSDDVRLMTLQEPSADLLSIVVTAEDYETAVAEGQTAVRRIAADSMLSRVDLADRTATTALRTISLAVASTDAVGRSLVAGDRVDLISVTDGRAAYVVTEVEVVAVASNTQPSQAGAAVTVAVGAPASLRIAWALSRGELRIVRATGATTVDPALVYPASEEASDAG